MNGKKFSLLKSVFKSINIRYEYEKVTLEVEQNVDIILKTAERTFSYILNVSNCFVIVFILGFLQLFSFHFFGAVVS